MGLQTKCMGLQTKCVGLQAKCMGLQVKCMGLQAKCMGLQAGRRCLVGREAGDDALEAEAVGQRLQRGDGVVEPRAQRVGQRGAQHGAA